jgi:hypothetical protein
MLKYVQSTVFAPMFCFESVNDAYNVYQSFYLQISNVKLLRWYEYSEERPCDCWSLVAGRLEGYHYQSPAFHILQKERVTIIKACNDFETKMAVFCDISTIYVWLYCPLLDLGRFFSFLIFLTQSLGLLERGISPSKGRYLHTDIHASSGIRTHDPSVWAGEDCLRVCDICLI